MGPYTMSVSTPRLPEARNRSAQKDKIIRMKLETELSRRNVSLPSTQNGAWRTAPKGTLAAIRLPYPVIVSENATVTEATHLCVASRTDAFLVKDDTNIIGIVTSRDLVYRVIAEGLEPCTTPVYQIMTRDPVVMDASCTTIQALQQMLTKKFQHLPISGQDGNILGILNISQIFHDTLNDAYCQAPTSKKFVAGIPAEPGTNESRFDIFSQAPDLTSVVSLTTQPATASPKATVREVARLMKQKGRSAICVVEDATPASPGMARRRLSRLVGIFTLNDALLRIITPGLDASRCSVIRVMTPKPDTAYPEMSIYDTAKKMLAGPFLHMPVVEDNGRLVAVVDVYSLAEVTHEQIIVGYTNSRVPDVVGSTTDHSSRPISQSDTYRPAPHESYANATPTSLMVLPAFTEALASNMPAEISPYTTVDPPLDNMIFTFKFFVPSGVAYQITTRHDYQQVRDRITEKLQADSLFDVDFHADPSIRPDPSDYRISYQDEDGDTVVITSDRDIADAVRVSRKAGKDRVVLKLQGGRSWKSTPTGTDTQSMSSISTEKSGVVQGLAELSILNPDNVTELSPPEYTANSRWHASDIEVDVSATGLRKGHISLDSKFPLTSKTQMQHAILSQMNDAQWINVEMETNRIQRSEPVKSKDTDVEALVARLGAVFDNDEWYRQLLKCTDTDAAKLLNMFQTLLDTYGLSARSRRHLLVGTQRLSISASQPPTCYELENIEMVSEHPVDGGGFADIHKGHLLGQVVCLKVLRVYHTSDEHSVLKHLFKEAILWRQLYHTNLLPIYGLYRYKGRLCLVSPWMAYGSVIKFLLAHPDEDRRLLVLDVGSGLSYLHLHDIVHGDLKGANILVGDDKRARIADFGIASVSNTSIRSLNTRSSVGSWGGSIRWQSPELFDFETDEIVQNTKASDVYAFSCVAYEVFVGNVPFFEHPRDSVVMLKVTTGEKPSLPPAPSTVWGPRGLTQAVWLLMEACWNANPSQRPNICDVVSQYKSTVLVDDQRPLESADVILSTATFRHSVGGGADLPSVEEVVEILDRQLSM